MEEALKLFQDQYPIVIGDLSANIGKPQNPRSQQVADLLTDSGMMELLHRFWKNWRYRHVNTWPKVRQGRAMKANIDYILGTDRRRFKMVGIRSVMNYPSYHLVLRDRLLFSPTEVVHQCNAWGIPEQVVTVHGVSEDTEG